MGALQEQQDTDVKEGVLFAARYRIGQSLGSGGMGCVYLAEDTLLDNTKVALKVLHKNLTADEKQLQRFLREVQITRQITHKNIVRTFDVGQDEGRIFYSMEYVPGASLKDVLEKYTSLDIAEAVPILVDVASGLQAIHDKGVIHRDLKPANIILSRDGLARITDFGVARPQVSDLTHHTEVVGSTAYISPEAWTGNNIQYRTDLYALGVMAYEMLVGVPPFSAQSPAEYMFKHLEEAPPSLRTHNQEIPAWLDHLVIQMLAKDQFQRPESAQHIADCLIEGIGGVARSLDEAQQDIHLVEDQYNADTAAMQAAYADKKSRIKAIEASLRDTMSRDEESVIHDVIVEELLEEDVTLDHDPLYSIPESELSSIDAAQYSDENQLSDDSLAQIETTKKVGVSTEVIGKRFLAAGVATALSILMFIVLHYSLTFIFNQVSQVGGQTGWALSFIVAAVSSMLAAVTLLLPFLCLRILFFGWQGTQRSVYSAVAVQSQVSIVIFGLFSFYKVHLITNGSKTQLFMAALGALSEQVTQGVSQVLFNALTMSLLSHGIQIIEVGGGSTVRIINGFTLDPYYLSTLLFATTAILYLWSKKMYKVHIVWLFVIALTAGVFLTVDFLCVEYLYDRKIEVVTVPFAGTNLSFSSMQVLLALPKWAFVCWLIRKARA